MLDVDEVRGIVVYFDQSYFYFKGPDVESELKLVSEKPEYPQRLDLRSTAYAFNTWFGQEAATSR